MTESLEKNWGGGDVGIELQTEYCIPSQHS